MRRAGLRLAARLRRFLRGTRASATVEFVMIFPVFITIFASGFEAGLLATRQMMLEVATAQAVRNVQLGTVSPPSHAELKQTICDAALVIPGCMGAVHVELVRVSTASWALPPGPVRCIDRDEAIEPVVSYVPGASNEIMFVRVCAVFKPFFPTTGLGLKLPRVNSSDYALIAAAVFVNEPA